MSLQATQFITTNPVENFSYDYANDQTAFVAEKLFPAVPINGRTGKIYQHDRSKLKEVKTEATSKDEASRVDYGVFSRDIELEEHKLKGDIDPRDEKDFDRPVSDIRFDTAETILQKLLIRRERKAATLVETTSNYPSALQSALTTGTDRWIDSGGNIESDRAMVQNAVKLKCGRIPNAAQMSGTSFRLVTTSPYLIERTKYVSGQSISVDQLKNMLGVQYLFIGDAVYDSAQEGATENIGDIWADGCLFFVYDESVNPRTLRYGHTAIRKRGFWTEEHVDPKRGGAEGRIRELEIGWEYKAASGYVSTAADTDFNAGYYLDNIV